MQGQVLGQEQVLGLEQVMGLEQVLGLGLEQVLGWTWTQGLVQRHIGMYLNVGPQHSRTYLRSRSIGAHCKQRLAHNTKVLIDSSNKVYVQADRSPHDYEMKDRLAE